MVARSQGGFLWGAIRSGVAGEPLGVMECHCRDCQYASGGACATAVGIPAGAFKLTKGTPKHFSSKGDSGADAYRGFCGERGSPLFSEPPRGAILVVKAGSRDQPRPLKIGGPP